MKKYIICGISLFYFSLFSLNLTIPPHAHNIKSGDLDNDGDSDILVSHIIDYPYITIIQNNFPNGFEIVNPFEDTNFKSLFNVNKLDSNELPDVLLQDPDGNVLICYDSDFDQLVTYPNSFNGFNQATTGDIDGDNDNDIILSKYSGLYNHWGIMYNLGQREFSEIQWFNCQNNEEHSGYHQLECRDLDNDGSDDIIAYTSNEVYIYYNDNLTSPNLLNCYAPNGDFVCEDFDNDGDIDIVCMGLMGPSFSRFHIYENIGNQCFENSMYEIPAPWSDHVAGDINMDGFSDISRCSTGSIYTNYSVEPFNFSAADIQTITNFGGSSVTQVLLDLDGNGAPDFAMIRSSCDENNFSILFNDGYGYFLDDSPVNNDAHTIVNNSFNLTNYPNPFNPTTNISFTLPENINEPVLEIFNINGKIVKNIKLRKNSESKSTYLWDGKNNYNKKSPSGIYLYRINSSNYKSKLKKMVLHK